MLGHAQRMEPSVAISRILAKSSIQTLSMHNHLSFTKRIKKKITSSMCTTTQVKGSQLRIINKSSCFCLEHVRLNFSVPVDCSSNEA